MLSISTSKNNLLWDNVGIIWTAQTAIIICHKQRGYILLMILCLYTNVHQTIKLHKGTNRQISIITLQKYVEYTWIEIERVKFSIDFVSLLQLH